jgi:hypothetical protein
MQKQVFSVQSGFLVYVLFVWIAMLLSSAHQLDSMDWGCSQLGWGPLNHPLDGEVAALSCAGHCAVFVFYTRLAPTTKRLTSMRESGIPLFG